MHTTMSPPVIRWWRPLQRGDAVALAVMVLLPLVLFGAPALFGHPAIAQDNLIQNFPLRVLTGQQLRSGHLPLLNPLANSTTPLLGGLNAGSFFPTTLLFVVLPAILAWVLNLVAVYVAAAIGVFALLRWHGRHTLASCVAALVYAYSGSMMGQMVHLGVVQGYALLPWATLALLSMAGAVQRLSAHSGWRAHVRSMVPSVLALAVVWGLVCLTGEPRAIAETELLTLVVVPVALFVRSALHPEPWRERLIYLVGVVVAMLWGIVISLAQLLPGWSFIAQSQRASTSYTFFGAGSLPVRWTSMLLLSNILGGNGVAGQPSFFTNYNLPEVTGYTGLLALVAVAAFMTRLTKRGWRGDERDYVAYVAILVVGLIATWGSFTPLGHLFQQIPLFGSTRLQSRNIVLVDLAACVLLGWWLDRLERSDLESAGLLGRRRWVTISPVIATVMLSLAMMVSGPAIVRYMGAWSGATELARYEVPTLSVQLGLGLAIIALLIWRAHWRALVRWLCVLVAIDVTVFMLCTSTGFVAGNVNVMPSRAYAESHLGASGRFALVDPSGGHLDTFENLGAPNMNVFTGLPSVQGYGSLINSLYGNVTNTHPLFSLDPCQLAKGTFTQLRLAAIAVSTDKLAVTTSSGPAPALRCLALTNSVNTERYFGQLLHVRTISIHGSLGHSISSGSVAAQLLTQYGKPFGSAVIESGAHAMSFDFSQSHDVAAGVRITAVSGAVITSATVTQMDKSAPVYELNTKFQQALDNPSWRVAGTNGTLTIFKANHVRPPAWLGTHARTSSVLAIRNASWGDSWITVRATHPTVLKRSNEWLPGWRADALNINSRRSLTLDVVRSGLIQQVLVPPGLWRVHFHYHAPYIKTGLVCSSLGVIALLVAFVWEQGWLHRRRNGRVHS